MSKNRLHEAHSLVRFQTVCIEDDSVRTVRFLFILRFGSIYDDDDGDGDDDDCGANPR